MCFNAVDLTNILVKFAINDLKFMLKVLKMLPQHDFLDTFKELEIDNTKLSFYHMPPKKQIPKNIK